MLKGKKVIIRPFNEDDLELFYKWMTQQEHMGNFVTARMVYKHKFIENMKNLFSNKKSFYGMMEDRNNKPIGVISCHEQVDSPNAVEVGILIGDEDSRGKGLGEEALHLFVNYIFSTKPIMRIQFKTRVENLGMKRIGEKVGFKIEGILRGYMFDHGKNRDYYMAGITRQDWNTRNNME